VPPLIKFTTQFFGTGGLGIIAIEHHAQLKTTLEAAHKGVNIVLFNISDDLPHSVGHLSRIFFA
jgi:hypothetical protein